MRAKMVNEVIHLNEERGSDMNISIAQRVLDPRGAGAAGFHSKARRTRAAPQAEPHPLPKRRRERPHVLRTA